jgi:copper chaperone
LIKRVLEMTLELKVPNMACSACGESITKAVKAVDPAATVEADPKTKLVNVETQASETTVKQAITDAGYTVA